MRRARILRRGYCQDGWTFVPVVIIRLNRVARRKKFPAEMTEPCVDGLDHMDSLWSFGQRIYALPFLGTVFRFQWICSCLFVCGMSRDSLRTNWSPLPCARMFSPIRRRGGLAAISTSCRNRGCAISDSALRRPRGISPAFRPDMIPQEFCLSGRKTENRRPDRSGRYIAGRIRARSQARTPRRFSASRQALRPS